jgi:hypothetical protein
MGIVATGMMVFPGWPGGLAAASYDPPYEYYENRPVADVLPKDKITGPHYKIRETVFADGYMHSYRVDTDWGVFDVTGDYALRKLLKELPVIAKLKEIKKGEAYLKALAQSGTSPLTFTKDVLTQPVETLTSIPKGVAKLFSNAATGLTSKRDPSQDSRLAAALSMSSQKREYAYTFGVDPYSSNRVLQEELNSLGWAGAAGSLTVSAALAPFGGPAAMVISYTRLAKTFNDLLKDKNPEELRQINAKKLQAMGVSQELSKKFLDHPNFTPRHDTIIVGSLEMMGGTKGRNLFIQYALKATDEESANFVQNMAETLRGYQQGVAAITEIKMISGFIVAQAANQTVVAPFPLDYGVWTPNSEAVLKDVKAKAQQAGLKGKLELWVMGTVSPKGKKQLAALGIGLVDRLDQRFEYQY